MGTARRWALYLFAKNKSALPPPVDSPVDPPVIPPNSTLTTDQKRSSIYQLFLSGSSPASRKYKLAGSFSNLLTKMLPAEIDVLFTYLFQYFRNGITPEPGTAFYADLSAVSSKYGLYP